MTETLTTVEHPVSYHPRCQAWVVAYESLDRFLNFLFLWKVDFEKNPLLPIEKFPSLVGTIQECDNVTTPYYSIFALYVRLLGVKNKKI